MDFTPTGEGGDFLTEELEKNGLTNEILALIQYPEIETIGDDELEDLRQGFPELLRKDQYYKNTPPRTLK